MKRIFQKHETFLSELTAHEPRMGVDTILRCENLVDSSSVQNDELKKLLSRVVSSWKMLKQTAEERRIDHEEMLNIAKYFGEASEIEAWIHEKEQLVATDLNLVKDEDATEAMLTRHLTLISDIEAFGQPAIYVDLRFDLLTFTLSKIGHFSLITTFI